MLPLSGVLSLFHLFRQFIHVVFTRQVLIAVVWSILLVLIFLSSLQSVVQGAFLFVYLLRQLIGSSVCASSEARCGSFFVFDWQALRKDMSFFIQYSDLSLGLVNSFLKSLILPIFLLLIRQAVTLQFVLKSADAFLQQFGVYLSRSML